MEAAEQLITANLDIWSSAVKTKSTAGRGSNNKLELYGIKKLRELILELAMRGLLVPQNPNDEPANELLKKIAAKKAQLLKEGKIKKQKKLPPIEASEESFKLPEGWGFARFGAVLDFSGGSQPPKSKFLDEKLDGYVQLMQIRDLGPNPQPVYVPEDSVTKFCTTADVMIGRYGASVGKVFWGKDGAYNVALIRLHNDYGTYIPRFLFLLMNSPLGQSLFSGISRSAQAGFSKRDIEGKLLPVLGEEAQHRIVAKVDELMALCDQLEQQQESSITAHQTLVQTLLDTLTTASEREGFTAAWARIAEHFDTLFTTEWSIDQLKQTILQLAVMGKLVPQDPNDEPASELLKKIAAEEDKLVKGGRVKKQKMLPPVEDEEKSFELPQGWAWFRFSYLTHPEYPISYGVLVPGPDEIDGVPFVRIADLDIKNPPEFPEKSISVEIDSEYERTRLHGGEILMGIVGSIGKLGVAPLSWKGANIARAICRIKIWDFLSNDYLLILLQSEFMQKNFRGDTRTLAQPTLNIGLIRLSPTPIPPLSEQHLIVSKVDELMALCDALKTRLNTAQITQLQLADIMAKQAIA